MLATNIEPWNLYTLQHIWSGKSTAIWFSQCTEVISWEMIPVTALTNKQFCTYFPSKVNVSVYVKVDAEIRFSAPYCFVMFRHVMKDVHPTVISHWPPSCWKKTDIWRLLTSTSDPYTVGHMSGMWQRGCLYLVGASPVIASSFGLYKKKLQGAMVTTCTRYNTVLSCWVS